MIGDGLAGLGGLALFAVAGLGLTELAPALRRLPLARRLGYAYLLGLAAVAGTLYALSHFAAVPLRAPAVWTTAGAFVAVGLLGALGRAARLARRRSALPAGVPPAAPTGIQPPALRRRSLVSRLGGVWPLACFVLAAVLCIGLLADAATDPPKDWDGRMTWSAQARYVRAAGTVDAEVLRHRRWFVTHPQYPLLMPVAQVAVLEAFGQDEDSHAFRALYVGCFAAWLLILYDGARRIAGRTPAALAALFGALVPFFVHGEGGASSAYSDLPLAAFYGAALVLLVVRPPRLATAWPAGLFLGAAVLTKNEGLPLAALVLALAAGRALAARDPHGPRSHGATRRGLLQAAVAGVFALAAYGLLASWRAGIPNREDEAYFTLLRARALWPAIVTRVPRLAPVLLDRMFLWREWRAFWWAIPAVLAAGWRGAARPRHLPLLLAAAAPPAIGWIAYSLHPDPAFVASVTWARFLLQASVPLLLLVAASLADILRRERKQLVRAAN